MMLMVVGLSFLYVGRYGWGARPSGRFRARHDRLLPTLRAILELSRTAGAATFVHACLQDCQRDPHASRTKANQSQPTSSWPWPPGGYGLLIGGGGLIWTRGEHLILNLLARRRFSRGRRHRLVVRTFRQSQSVESANDCLTNNLNP